MAVVETKLACPSYSPAKRARYIDRLVDPLAAEHARRPNRVLGFPAYSVFYRVHGDVVLITAVFHGRRRSAAWQRRR